MVGVGGGEDLFWVDMDIDQLQVFLDVLVQCWQVQWSVVVEQFGEFVVGDLVDCVVEFFDFLLIVWNLVVVEFEFC